MNKKIAATGIILAVLAASAVTTVAGASDYSGNTHTYTESIAAGTPTYDDATELVYCPEGQYMLGGLVKFTNTLTYRYSTGDAVSLIVGITSASPIASNVTSGVSYDRVGQANYATGQSLQVNYVCVDNP